MLPLCLLGIHFWLENTVRLAQERNIVHALPDAAGKAGEERQQSSPISQSALPGLAAG